MPADFALLVAKFVDPVKPVWLWKFGGRRFLLRQSQPNSGTFFEAHGFKSPHYHKVFFDAFAEMGASDSEVFQYLGVIRLPSKTKVAELTEAILDNHVFPISHYAVLSTSTFTTKKPAS